MVKLLVVPLLSDRFCVINVFSIIFPLSPSHKRCHKISTTSQNVAFMHSPQVTVHLLLLWLIFSLVYLKIKNKKERPERCYIYYCQFNLNYGCIILSFTRFLHREDNLQSSLNVLYLFQQNAIQQNTVFSN